MPSPLKVAVTVLVATTVVIVTDVVEVTPVTLLATVEVVTLVGVKRRSGPANIPTEKTAIIITISATRLLEFMKKV